MKDPILIGIEELPGTTVKRDTRKRENTHYEKDTNCSFIQQHETVLGDITINVKTVPLNIPVNFVPLFHFFAILKGSNVKMLITIVFLSQKHPANMYHTGFIRYFEKLTFNDLMWPDVDLKQCNWL